MLVSGVLPEIGETLDLFDWPEPLAVGNAFSQVELPPGTVWDLSQLYTTGEITLIPEPVSSAMFVVALVSLVCCYRIPSAEKCAGAPYRPRVASCVTARHLSRTTSRLVSLRDPLERPAFDVY